MQIICNVERSEKRWKEEIMWRDGEYRETKGIKSG